MKRLGLVVALLVLCLGCARQHQVTDPGTGRVYYTRDVDKRDSGAAEFTDEKTKAKVTLRASVIEKISKEMVRILNLPDVREKISGQGAIPGGNSPKEFTEFVAAEVEKWGKVIKSANIRAQ